MADLEQMARQQRNIGSVKHMSQSLQARRPSKKRRISDDLPINSSNHNRSGMLNNQGVGPDTGNVLDLTAFEAINIPPKLEKKDVHKPMRMVLDQLQDKLDVFERLQLDKKKVETAEITATKMEAMAKAMEDQFLTKPHLIGAIPSVHNQGDIAFSCWFSKHHDAILKTESIKADLDLFITQLVSLQAADVEWKEFLIRWKLLRIVHQDDFQAVWKSVQKEMNIPGSPVIELAVFSDEEEDQDLDLVAANDKEEM